MLEKYRATVHGNTIEWDGDVPEEITKAKTLDVYVMRRPNGKKAVEALQKIADRGGVKSIPDPDKWLQEIREDRVFPGRE